MVSAPKLAFRAFRIHHIAQFGFALRLCVFARDRFFGAAFLTLWISTMSMRQTGLQLNWVVYEDRLMSHAF